jgi:MSHA biogenesis protein MshG
MSGAFVYRARDGAGTLRTGVLNAPNPSAAARDLSAMGWVPLEIHAQAAGPVDKDGQALRLDWAGLQARWKAATQGRAGKATAQHLGLVLRELSSLLRAGVPLLRALALAADSTPDTRVRAMLQRLTRDLDNGHTLVAAAERESRHATLLTAYDVAMLQVGERTGRLPEAFAELYRHREFVRSTNEQVSAALRYPAFVIATCLLAVVVVNLFVIPSFAKVFAQARAELPLLTTLLLHMSQGMKHGWPWLLAGTAGAVFGWRRWLARTEGRLWWDRVKLRLPIVGPILEGIVVARLATSLASAMQAGLTISDALTVTARTLGNAWYETRVAQMCHDLARGSSITAAARNMAVLPPTMLQLFAIGEESGSLEELMREIAVHYQGEVDYAVKRLSATLEPLLIWFLGMGILVLALGIFMPMWDLGRATIR